MKKIIFTLIFTLFLVSCTANNNIATEKQSDKSLQVVSTIVPFASIAQYIWWDKVDVNSIIPAGFSPHIFDLKPSDIKILTNADIIFSTWLELDAFILKEKYSTNIELKNYVTLLEWHEHNHDEHEDHKDEHNDEHEGHEDENHDEHEEESIYFDPHLWLSLENWNKIAETMKDNFIVLDSENKDYYEQNYSDFLEKSKSIKNAHLKEIEWKTISHFVIFHEAYNYLFREFWIDDKYAVILEETAWREPSVADMKNILDTINSNNIKVLFKEPQFESKLIAMLQGEEYNLTIDILDPLWQWVDKNSYFDNIEQNLNNLIKIYE